MKLTQDMKVVCVCRGGQVRSVSARFILADTFGFHKVLACGWEKNDRETVEMLFEWADAILVVGSAKSWTDSDHPLFIALRDKFREKSHLLEIGSDRFGHYGNTELVGILTPMLKGLLC